MVSAVEHVEKSLRANGARVVFLAPHSLSDDNLSIKTFGKRNPEVLIFTIFSRSFDPELQEGLSPDVSACRRKPVDPEERLYLLRGILKKEPGARDSPKL